MPPSDFFPFPVIAGGFIPQGLSGGGVSPYTYGCRHVSGGNAGGVRINQITLDDTTIPFSELMMVATPQSSYSSATTFGPILAYTTAGAGVFVILGSALDIDAPNDVAELAFDCPVTFVVFKMPRRVA